MVCGCVDVLAPPTAAVDPHCRESNPANMWRSVSRLGAALARPAAAAVGAGPGPGAGAMRANVGAGVGVEGLLARWGGMGMGGGVIATAAAPPTALMRGALGFHTSAAAAGQSRKGRRDGGFGTWVKGGTKIPEDGEASPCALLSFQLFIRRLVLLR